MSKHVFGMWLFGSNKNIIYIYIHIGQAVRLHPFKAWTVQHICTAISVYIQFSCSSVICVMFTHVVFTHIKKKNVPEIIISMGFQDIPTIPKWTPHHDIPIPCSHGAATGASSWCGGDSRPGEDKPAGAGHLGFSPMGFHPKMIYKWWMLDKHLKVYRHLGWSGMFIWYHLILSKRHEHSTWTT